jgi:hypothetical protein
MSGECCWSRKAQAEGGQDALQQGGADMDYVTGESFGLPVLPPGPIRPHSAAVGLPTAHHQAAGPTLARLAQEQRLSGPALFV